MKLSFYFSLLPLFLGGCASTALDRYYREPNRAPDFVYLEKVPFVEQTEMHCGPAALSMLSKWSGRDISPDHWAELTFTPGKEGSFQTDLIGAARREGFLAIPLQGYKAIFAELLAGTPVLVLQNLGFSWYPIWHYSVVTGYDLEEKEIRLHSGHRADWRVSLSSFESEWKSGDHWALVLLPAGKLSASADEIDHLRAAAALERVEHFSEAEKVYEAVLTKWPESIGALVGLGNVTYQRKDYAASVRALEQATKIDPEFAAAWHNLALAYAEKHQWKAAKKSAKQAMAKARPDDRAQYEESLKALL